MSVEFVEQARVVFGKARRPKHFTSLHCDECIEHDEEMRPFNNDTLTLKPLGHPGWNPICFLTPEAFRYFMPGLIRIQIEELMTPAEQNHGFWNLFLIDYSLSAAESTQFSLLTSDEVAFVAKFYTAFLACPGCTALFDWSGNLEKAAAAWFARAAATQSK